MGSRVTSRVEDSQKNETNTTGHGEEDGERREDLLRLAVIHGQAAFMSEPALGDEDRVEEHHHDRGARDEQRFAPGRRAQRRDVHDPLSWVVPWVARVALRGPHAQHGDEGACIVLLAIWD